MTRFRAKDHKPIVITFDGTSASGKGTLVGGVRERLGKGMYREMDAGAMYRALTLHCLNEGISPQDISKSPNEILDNIDLEMLIGGGVRLNGSIIDDSDLRTERIDMKVADYSGTRDVKLFAVEGQKSFVSRYSGDYGLILDGRCMGTAVAPEAQIKFYTDAEIWARAAWRQRDYVQKKGLNRSVEAVKIELEQRDRKDLEATLHPLKRPSDAYDIETHKFAPKEGVDHAFSRIKSYLQAS